MNFLYPDACIYLVINIDGEYFIGHCLTGIYSAEKYTESRYRNFKRKRHIEGIKKPKLMKVLDEDHEFVHLINIPVNSSKELIPGKEIFRKYLNQKHVIDKYLSNLFGIVE